MKSATKRFPGMEAGSPVVVYLRDPKEKVWGLLGTLLPAGVIVRGIDIAAFDDWMRQQARAGDDDLGPTTLFYPMHRVDRIEVDETQGPVRSYADRFAAEVGRSVATVVGTEPRRRRKRA